MDKWAALRKIEEEYFRTSTERPNFVTIHRGYLAILQEMVKLWEEVNHRPRDAFKVESAAVELGAMVVKFLVSTTPKRL